MLGKITAVKGTKVSVTYSVRGSMAKVDQQTGNLFKVLVLGQNLCVWFCLTKYWAQIIFVQPILKILLLFCAKILRKEI